MRSGSDSRRGRPYNGDRPFQPQQRGQTFDSNGPGVRFRGSAHQIYERYIGLAREAAIGGDPVAAENLYQHAEHYLRLANAAHDGSQHPPPQLMTPADIMPTETGRGSSDTNPDDPQLGFGDDRPGFI